MSKSLAETAKKLEGSIEKSTKSSVISAKQLGLYIEWKKLTVLKEEVPVWVACAGIPLQSKNSAAKFHFYFADASCRSLQKAKSLLLTQVRDFLVVNDDLTLS